MNILALTTLCLTAAIVVLETLHFVERRELCDRLMCKSLDEYRRGTRSRDDKETPRESGHQRAIREWRERGNNNAGQ